MSKVQSRIGLLVAIVALLVLAPIARGESADARFLAGLRQRQLFGLAEIYCADRLKTVATEDETRAELTIEFIRTLAEHAVNVQPEERAALWSQARAVAADFLRQTPLNPRAIQVRLQDALT